MTDKTINLIQDSPNNANQQTRTRSPAIDFQQADPLDGLYLHIPFCFHKCHYCDFYSLVDTPEQNRQPDFIDALVRELEHWFTNHPQATPARPRTLFVGGGTPTLLAPELWARLLEKLERLQLTANLDEFTVEANPETVTLELMQTLAQGGVNRVSIGAQTFHPQHLKTLERWHDPASVPQAVQTTRDAGITNLNLDLIFAIPGQTVADLDHDLDQALALQPDHLSCYSLIFEPNTPLAARRDRGQIAPADEELERNMYAHVIQRLTDAGYEHYEISNFAKRTPKGPRVAQHNLVYWHNHNHLGLGPGAASHLNGTRWKNQPNLTRYTQQSPNPPITQLETLDPDARLGEALMLGLRLRQGVLTSSIPQDDRRQPTLQMLLEQQLLETHEGRYRLTDKGLFLADAVLAELL